MLSGQNAIKNKRYGYSTSSFGRKNENNSSIELNLAPGFANQVAPTMTVIYSVAL